MLKWLVAVMIVIPAVEIWGLIQVGSWIGGWQTVFLIVLTGALGAYMAKREGLKVWSLARLQMSSGQVPTQSILDGICIFAGGLLLLTPGFLTDIAGFLLVFPPTRVRIRAGLSLWIQKKLLKGSFNFIIRR